MKKSKKSFAKILAQSKIKIGVLRRIKFLSLEEKCFYRFPRYPDRVQYLTLCNRYTINFHFHGSLTGRSAFFVSLKILAFRVQYEWKFKVKISSIITGPSQISYPDLL